MAERHYHIILNERAGTVQALGLTCEVMSAKFTANDYKFDIDADDTRPLEDRIAKAIAGPADVIVAAGGDGTAAAIAQALVGTEKTLAALPLGTYNALSKDLGVPLNIDLAIAALRNMEKVKIDVADVNGHVFLHNVLIGAMSAMTAAREKMRGATTLQWLGFFRFALKRLARTRRMAVAIEPDSGERRVERVHAMAVANNSYDQRLGAFLTRKRLDRGLLTLYVMKTFGVADAFRLLAEMLAGTWRDDVHMNYEHIKGLTIHTHKPKLLVSLDGEALTLETPLTFTVVPQGLMVLGDPEAPPVKAAETVPEPEPLEA
ncbi:MAG: diacylglycerol kinase family protein [Devosia sp.]